MTNEAMESVSVKEVVKAKKKDLVNAIQTNLDNKEKAVKLSKIAIGEVLMALPEAILEVLKEFDTVGIPNLMTVNKQFREQYVCKNPKTQEEMTVEATNIVKIKKSNKFSDLAKETLV